MVLSILFFLAHLFCHHTATYTAIEMSTFYGSMLIEEPVLVELLGCPSMQRLKNVQQYGVTYYIKDSVSYNRFEHSLGVFYFVRTFGGGLHEQIAALLHDVSHTVFSHVGDHLFKHHSDKSSYQNDVHLWFIEQTEIKDILQKYRISLSMIDHKCGRFSILEQDLPDLCADRLEYVLYGGFIENKLTRADIQYIINSLEIQQNKFVFNNIKAAQLFAKTSLYLSEHIFGSAFNYFTNHLAGKILRRALKMSVVALDEIFHSADLLVWDRLCQSDDSKIKSYMNKLYHYQDYFQESDSSLYDLYAKSKFRGIDPLVITQMGIQALTMIDDEYCALFHQVKKRMNDGLYLITR